MLLLPAMAASRRPTLITSVLALAPVAATVGHAAARAPAAQRWIVFAAHPNGGPGRCSWCACVSTAPGSARSRQARSRRSSRTSRPTESDRVRAARLRDLPDERRRLAACAGSRLELATSTPSGRATARRSRSCGRSRTAGASSSCPRRARASEQLPQAPPAGRPSWTRERQVDRDPVGRRPRSGRRPDRGGSSGTSA